MKFCRDRYRVATQELTEIWNDFLPIAQLAHWSMGDTALNDIYESFFNPLFVLDSMSAYTDPGFDFSLTKATDLIPNAVTVLKSLARLDDDALSDPFIRRDFFDIGRTVLVRYAYAGFVSACEQFGNWRHGKEIGNDFDSTMCLCIALMELLRDFLGEHEDYSMLHSFEKLKETAPVNPVFEETLKENSADGYNRSFVYETFGELVIPEMQLLFKWFADSMQCGNRDELPDSQPYRKQVEETVKLFLATPLTVLGNHETRNARKILAHAAGIISKLNL